MHNNKLRLTIAAILSTATLAYGGLTLADTDTTTTDGGASQGQVVTKLSAEFADFLGGQEEAAAVINDLRDGSYGEPVADSTPPPTTEDSTAGGDTGNTDAPTGTDGAITDTPTDGGTLAGVGTGDTTTGAEPGTSDTPDAGTTEGTRSTMGYGNIRITLKMAQAELGKLGITEPTQDELAAALNGGTIDGAELDGILAMRADGMGWGTIAKANGYTVGSLMGKGHARPKPVHPGSSSDYIPSGSSGSGIQSAAGSSATVAKAKGKSKVHSAGDYIPSGKPGKAHGQGMVSGLGGGIGAGTSAKGGGAKGGYKGGGVMVSAAGGGAGAVTVAAASNKGGAGRGLAKGHTK